MTDLPIRHTDKLYIDGAWVRPSSETLQPVENPATENVIAHTAQGTAADVETAVAAARQAFITFSETTPPERAALIDRIIDAYEARLDDFARIIALDERGKLLTSPQFADHLARWRDDGIRDTALIIGGADGIDPTLRARADLSLSFGKMVWPHMLVRVMLAEQIYRATTILAGSPYHRS